MSEPLFLRKQGILCPSEQIASVLVQSALHSGPSRQSAAMERTDTHLSDG